MPDNHDPIGNSYESVRESSAILFTHMHTHTNDHFLRTHLQDPH